MHPRIDLCGSCGAAIIWAETRAGKPMPVDANRGDVGNVELTTLICYPPKWRATVYPVDCPGLYVSHFATCPNADKHRSK